MDHGNTHKAARSANFPIGASIHLEDLSRDPYAIFARLHQAEPITWVPALDMWYVVRHADADAIMNDLEHFTTASDHSTIYDTFGAHMLTVEGSLHDRYKAAARKPFMPKSIRELLEGRITALVDALIDGFEQNKAVELRHAFAARLPIQTMLTLFGLVPDEERHLRLWYDSFEQALANFTWDEAIRVAARKNVASFHHLLAVNMERVAREPDDSFLSTLVNAPAEDRLSDEEIKRNALIIFFGGISTVEALILNTIFALTQHPQSLARVQSDRSLLPQTLDEGIRWMAPVQSATRHVIKDITLHGVTFVRGETVNCMLGAANHDPAVFTEPAVFDIDRKNAKRHLGFATGPHHCLGSHLAKAEARIAVDRLLTRLPNLRADRARPAIPSGYEFRQPKEFWLMWD